ncbi:MAG: DUF3616 domain-containing protein [Alphaproteobacteria bacterium]|nr:DUF3616 domain-containing protein [Alphaproteobacteria bacterium]
MPDDLSPAEEKSIDLDLRDKAVIVKKNGETREVIRNLSGGAVIGDSVYLADDEGRRLLHLRLVASRRYEIADTVKMTALFDIADETDKKKEFDLEALAVDRIDEDTTRLWLIGSHAMGHAKPESGDLELKRVGLKRERNRLLFGCVDIDKNGPVKGSGRHLRIKPARETHTTEFLTALRTAPPAAIGLLREVSALAKISADAGVGWFTPYTMASTKENGLDVEGLAIRRHAGDHATAVALVGLRGPVIDGFAVLIEIRIRDHSKRGLKTVGKPRFHLLNLEGFGIRDLEWRDKDLLILAGPTMTRQRESALFRWNGAWKNIAKGGKNVVEVNDIETIGSLRMPEDKSGPEVFTIVTPQEPEYMLLRDGIGKDRLRDQTGKASDLGPVYHTEIYRIADR